MHRFVWDLHYERVPGDEPEYPISAIYGNTAPEPDSPWVMPGEYTVVLKVGDRSYSEKLTVKMDPRVKTSLADLQNQFDLSKQLYDARLRLEPINNQLFTLAGQLEKTKTRPEQNAFAAQIDALDKKLIELSGAVNHRPGTPLRIALLDRIQTLFGRIQETDAAPTPIVKQATLQALSDFQKIVKDWEMLEKQDIPELKRQFKLNGLPDLNLVGRQPKHIKADKDEDDEEDNDPTGKP
jgi:hypothetical protein